VQKFQESGLDFEQLPAYAFNRWLINNSATGDVLLANTVMATSNDVIVNIVSENQASMPFVNNTVTFNGTIFSITANNSFIYVGGGGGASGNRVQKFHESNLAFIGNTVNSLSGTVNSITTNNGFLYVGGGTFVEKHYESNLTSVGNTSVYGSFVIAISVNNGFIYAGGGGNASANRNIKKYHESNLQINQTSVG